MLGFYRTYTTPFEEKIPVFLEDFFAKVSLYKRIRRFISRYLYTEIRLRNSKKIYQITTQHKRILWVQWVDAYLGDSLMDLSSRALLKNKKIDLLTKDYVARIYANDPVFVHIFTSATQCHAKHYDLMILGSYRQRELKILTPELLKLPHASLYGYYHVPDFNRLYFSYFRINHLLLKPYNSEYIQNMAKPLLPISKIDIDIIDKHNLPNNFITIAIGGANRERIYVFWDKVIKILITESIVENIVLVGQVVNQEAENIQKISPNKIINLVDTCSFNQTTEVIKRSIMLLCCDGGLLHAANAVQTPVVALFYLVNPITRLIKINQSYSLIDKNDINNISSADIIKKVKLLKMWSDE